MKKIIFESFQDVETTLRGSGLVSELVEEFSDLSSAGSREVCDYIVEKISREYDEDNVKSEKVVVCKVVGEEVDLVEQSHYVINYNNNYYDYCAQKHNDSFNGMIGVGNLPVVQPVIHSDNQINDKLSTVKGYVLLGY